MPCIRSRKSWLDKKSCRGGKKKWLIYVSYSSVHLWASFSRLGYYRSPACAWWRRTPFVVTTWGWIFLLSGVCVTVWTTVFAGKNQPSQDRRLVGSHAPDLEKEICKWIRRVKKWKEGDSVEVVRTVSSFGRAHTGAMICHGAAFGCRTQIMAIFFQRKY